MISSFEFRLVYVSEPTSLLRVLATVEKVERDGLHGLSCTKSAGRFSRHATLNSLIKQTLGSLDLPSKLEPRGLYRTDGKGPDGVIMIPWKMGKQLVWDVTVVDALAPSRLNQGLLCNFDIFLKVLHFVDVSVGCVAVGYDIPENFGSLLGPDLVFEWILESSKSSVWLFMSCVSASLFFVGSDICTVSYASALISIAGILSEEFDHGHSRHFRSVSFDLFPVY